MLKNYTDSVKTPPFRDAHMHFMIDGMPADTTAVAEIKERCLRCGIFSIDDMGHKSGIGLEAKRVLSGQMMVRTAGSALYKRGAYGSFLGKGVSGKEEIKRAVKEIADSGADFVKVINSGIVSSKGLNVVTEGGFSPEELKIIGSEAKENGLSFRCHANSDVSIKDAVIAGAASIEHGYFVSHETLLLMAEKNIPWTPTVYALLSLSPILPDNERLYIEEIIDKHLSLINYAASIGVQLNIGTDSGSKGVRHGESFFDELQLFQKAGLSSEQILSAACMSRDEIEKGNFLIVKRDFIDTKRIAAVFRKGEEYSPE